MNELDRKKIMELVDGDEGLLAELAILFFAQSEKWMKEIEEAVAHQNANALARAAHSLKGAAGNFSTGSIYDILVELEELAQGAEMDPAKQKLPSLSLQIRRLNADLEPYRKRGEI